MIKKNEKFIFVSLSSLLLYIILFICKDFIFSFLNIENETLLVFIEYQFLILALSISYYINMIKNDKYKDGLINMLIGFLSISIYFLLNAFQLNVLNFFGINKNSPALLKSIFSILYEIIIMLILILINIKSYKKDFIDMKKNHKNYFSKYIKYWLIAVFIMMGSNLIINLLNNGNIAGNEQTIRNAMKTMPVYLVFSSVVFAPIVEELIFRKSIKNIIPSTYLFIIISGIVFGGLHVVGNVKSWVDLLYIIPYSSCGIAFAYTLAKTDNILVTTGLHMLHNGIISSLEVLLLILGVL